MAFLGAKKTISFPPPLKRCVPAVWLPRIPDNCFVTSFSYFSICRMTHSAQTMFGFSSTWMRSCRKTLLTFYHIRLCHVYSKWFIRTNWEVHWNRFLEQLTVLLFSLLTKVLLLPGLSTQTGHQFWSMTRPTLAKNCVTSDCLQIWPTGS